MDEQREFSIWALLAQCAVISSVAAVSGQLALGRPVELTKLIGAALWSCLAGRAIGAFLAPYLADDLYLLMTVSTLAGIGAASLVELLFLGLRHGVAVIILLGR